MRLKMNLWFHPIDLKPNKRLQGTRHKVSGPLTPDIGCKDK